MGKKRLTGAELLEAYRAEERKAREKQEQVRQEKLLTVEHKCKNCKRSWYKYIPPTGFFKDPSEYCGCREKNSLVDPQGCCESFDPR